MQKQLLPTLQQYFGYPELQKIDPNTQEVTGNDNISAPQKFAQAILPTVIIGISRYLHTDQGWLTFQRGESYPNWGSVLFGKHSVELSKRIADYSGWRREEVMPKMHDIIERALWTLRNMGIETDEELKNYIETERKTALSYLPEKIRLGELMGNDALDDRINKMEGPISTMIKALGGSFDSAETKNTNGETLPETAI